MSQSPVALMWKVFLRKQGRTGKHTAHPESTPEKPCKCRCFPGLFFHALPPLAAHIRPLLLPQGSPGAGRGAIPLPPVREKDPTADGARPGFRDTLHGQRPFQHRIKGQHRRAEIAAICPRPAFPQHIAGTVQRQAAIVFIVVGAPLCHQLADLRLFLPSQFTAHVCPLSWA